VTAIGRSPVDELRSQLAASETVDELEQRLLTAAPRFHEALQRKTLVGRREDLGLRVISLDMPYQGLAGLGGQETLVALKEGINSVSRRQTLAHECAHGLLRDVDRPRLKLTREREDRLCTQFARLALMPKDRVESHLAAHGFPASVDSLEAFCGHFHVSLRAAIARLNEHGYKAGPTVLIAATFRAHEKRPGEFDFRVDAAASARRLFAPRDWRLNSMGLRELVRWAEREEPGVTRSGVEAHVLLRARQSQVQCWHGEAIWSARVFNAPSGHERPDARSLIAVLDGSHLKPLPTDPTRKHAPLKVSSLHAEQTSFSHAG
jgi:Zn-dependent peptidase ImmA (M78 family)